MKCNNFDKKPVRTGSDTPWKENNMKIAIVTDSNSGITQAQAGELGIFVLPMPFMINGETFEEDINLTQLRRIDCKIDSAAIVRGSRSSKTANSNEQNTAEAKNQTPKNTHTTSPPREKCTNQNRNDENSDQKAEQRDARDKLPIIEQRPKITEERDKPRHTLLHDLTAPESNRQWKCQSQPYRLPECYWAAARDSKRHRRRRPAPWSPSAPSS